MENELLAVKAAFDEAKKLKDAFNKKYGYVLFGCGEYSEGIQLKNVTYYFGPSRVRWDIRKDGVYPFEASLLLDGVKVYSLHTREEYEQITGKHITL
jgi:hypothetical protein